MEKERVKDFSGDEWVLDSEISELQGPFDATVEARLRTYGLDDGEIDRFVIAFREVVENAIIHGNKLDPSKKVRIEWHFGAGVLDVAVFDEGKGFERKDTPSEREIEKGAEPELDEEEILKIGGKGVGIAVNLLGPSNVIFEEGVVRLRMQV